MVRLELLPLIFLEKISSGIGTVGRLFYAIYASNEITPAPRTREGFYHYTGGVEVRWLIACVSSSQLLISGYMTI